MFNQKVNGYISENPDYLNYSYASPDVSSLNIHKCGTTINKYTKDDPTLPRINTILCPNPDCPTNKDGKEREIIYIRYDDVNMKYVYLCYDCETVWEIKENS